MRRLRPGFLLLLAAAGAVLLLVMRRNLNEPHLRLFTEMVDSPAYGSQELNPVLRDGKTLQRPVRGTIPRGFKPLHYGNTAQERKRAGRELKNPVPATFAALERGKKVYTTFCSHCHGKKGRGRGKVAKVFAGFSYPVATKSAYDMPDGTIFHIITYGRNLMPSHGAQIVSEDRWKLIYYLRDLQRIEIARLGPLAEIPEDPRRHHLVSAKYGSEIFATNCASCHGKKGQKPKAGVPTLNSPVVLAVADDAFYWDLINHGRKGTQMPAWKNILTRTQIKSLIEHMRSWVPPRPDRAKILARRGNAARGRAIYRGHCTACHGVRGEGGIGNSLNAPSFLALASDEFLRDTILQGRKHTAMPSSYDFTAGDISDLIAFIRGWSPIRHSFSDVMPLISSGSARIGKKIYRARCSGCHGRKGEGGIGSRLNSDPFLRIVDDEFLYLGITEGRPGTAMPSWTFLPAQDIADLIVFMRGWQKSPSNIAAGRRATGRPELGEVLFRNKCEKCHAKEGGGDIGSQIGNLKFLEHVSDEFIRRTVLKGKKGTEMKGFQHRKRDPLNEADVDHIIAYLRFLQTRPQIDLRKRKYTWADDEEGKDIYEKTAGCAKCHGMQGEGASGPSLSNSSFLSVASDGFIAGTVILGREGTEMLSYYRGGNVRLSQEDVENVVAYVRSFERKKITKRRRVPSSPAAVSEGKELYRKFCGACHGSEGRGVRGNKINGFAPSLNNEEFLNAADDGLLLATIALGRPNTVMRPFGEGAGGIADLSAADIRRIVAYIRSWEKK